MKFKIVILLLSSLFVVACSNGGSSKKGGGAGGAVTQEDIKRWPESGEYTVSFSYNGCTDEYHFFGKAQYCVALTDESQSKCNTQSQRRRAYEAECGNDFEPRNISGFEIAGYDRNLNARCEVKAKGPFPRLIDLCLNIKDELLHKGCFWEERQNYFKKYSCKGDFSPKPIAPQPPVDDEDEINPEPGPTTTTQALPESNFQKMQKAYLDIGIKVELARSHGMGDSISPREIESIASILMQAKDDFAARSKSYEGINISSYTVYRPGDLTLGVRLTLSDLKTYLSLNDQRISLLQSTGVFTDFGIDIYGRSNNNDENLQEMSRNLNFFTARRSDLKMLSSLFKTVKLTDHDSIQFYDNTLELNEKTYVSRLPKLISLLKPFADLATNGASFEGYLFGDKSEEGLQQLSAWLTKNKTGMMSLAQYTKLQGEKFEIDIDGEYDSEPLYSPTLGKLSINIKNAFDPSGMNALIALAPTLAHMNVELDLDGRLNKDFVAGAKLLAQRSSKLKSLKSKIEKIRIGSSKTDYSYKVLWLSVNGTLAELDKVLNSIK